MKVQGNSILILPEGNAKKTKGGILIPEIASKTKSVGEVVDCGSECSIVKKGDRVHYSPKNGSIETRDGVDHHYVLELAIQIVL